MSFLNKLKLLASKPAQISCLILCDEAFKPLSYALWLDIKGLCASLWTEVSISAIIFLKASYDIDIELRNSKIE